MSAVTVKRVGHKGADLLAPGNTRASFDAALEAGVDMIEFDVLPDLGPDGKPDTARGRLLLAHDYEDAKRADVLGLGDGLAHLADSRFDGIELDVDLKIPGYELRVVDALRAHDLVERTLISTTYPESLARIRAYEPRLRLGWSVPRAKRDYTASVIYKLPAYAAVLAMQQALPRRAAQALVARRCDALMVHWRLVTPRLVAAVDGAGGELYVWTVDDAAQIRRLVAMGVSGVITNDPRLFR
ncbi:glycerophosphodiester phosphodiesterase [Conexibacter stalactiti]|uniref:Glycerophosphodiester phosphodiesterase n=1 Tax=Conexibacter stalactiti TaxID=1940611 RepID=A0ABU4HQ24_9ACTN|nr:glycerophosphodiester phosphodiesterase [Conexibacter stalactiti]MDW5595344.1 glycerophosphodiester phosphodiesterase [Conexibacter stalactiti]MEC5035986.1 glycerophosphodiester phosphodiesterase [Conexibacter stalactiti]